MPGRKFNTNAYKYGMNGQEKDIEIAEGVYSAMYWEYDSRLGRRWNIDPVVKPFESPYASFGDNPILNVDINGDDIGVGTTGDHKGKAKDETSEKAFNDFMDSFKKIFNGKVDIETNDFGVNSVTKITGLKVKEGAKLNKKEQASFDYLSKIASSTVSTLWVGLADYITDDDITTTQLFSGKDENSSKDFGDYGYFKADIVFNPSLVKSVDKLGSFINSGSIINLGLARQTGNLESYKKATGFDVDKISYSPYSVGMWHNYSSTVIRLKNHRDIAIIVNLTKTVCVITPSYFGKKRNYPQKDLEADELKINGIDDNKNKWNR
jgi:hypothetical protein